LILLVAAGSAAGQNKKEKNVNDAAADSLAQYIQRVRATTAVAEAITQKGGLSIARMIVNHFRYLAEDGS
jgi:hypothetical protein